VAITERELKGYLAYLSRVASILDDEYKDQEAANLFRRSIKILSETLKDGSYGDVTGDSGAMRRNFVEPRYDIKPHQGGWVIIDTKNRNAISSRVFSDRLEALRGAKRMDRGESVN